MIAEWEWMIMLVLVLGLLVVELVRTRRAIRRAGDKPSGAARAVEPSAAAAHPAATAPPGSPPAA